MIELIGFVLYSGFLIVATLFVSHALIERHRRKDDAERHTFRTLNRRAK